MNATKPDTHDEAEQPVSNADTLRVHYALEVKGREQLVCGIRGSADIPYALHCDQRRDTAVNFNKLMALLLVQPALVQVSSFVNGLRRADIEARESAPSGEAPPTDEPQQHASLATLASLNDTMPEAVEPPSPPDLSPDAPATVLIA